MNACVHDCLHFGHHEPSGMGQLRSRCRAGHEDHQSCPWDTGPVLGDPTVGQESGPEFFQAIGQRSWPRGGGLHVDLRPHRVLRRASRIASVN